MRLELKGGVYKNTFNRKKVASYINITERYFVSLMYDDKLSLVSTLTALKKFYSERASFFTEQLCKKTFSEHQTSQNVCCLKSGSLKQGLEKFSGNLSKRI